MDELKNNVFPKEHVENKLNATTVDDTLVNPKDAEATKKMLEQAQKELELIAKGEKPIRPELAFEEGKIKTAVSSKVYDTQATKEHRPIQQPVVEKPIIETPIVNTSQPVINDAKKDVDEPYDLIMLPSLGKIYPHKKTHLKVSYLTGVDENILTSPNILQSGKFLSILLNRKILDPEVTYDQLHIGDRNAIMLWLRGTAYGENYPVVFYDEHDKPFESVVDISTLPYKKLEVEPDAEGLFHFTLPVSKKTVKFKFLNLGETQELEDLIDNEIKLIEEGKLEYSNAVTARLEKTIVELDGSRDRECISNFVKTMRAGDSRALRNYYDEIESGVDLEITVETPGGGLINSFLPINTNFFWPDFRI